MNIKKTLLACIGLVSASYGSTGGEMHSCVDTLTDDSSMDEEYHWCLSHYKDTLDDVEVCVCHRRIFGNEEYHDCFKSCKKYCVNVLGKFANEWENNRNAKVPKYWKCFGKRKYEKIIRGEIVTVYKYVVVNGIMYVGDIKPKHKHNVLCFVPGICYSVIKDEREFDDNELAKIVINKSIDEIIDRDRYAINRWRETWDELSKKQKRNEQCIKNKMVDKIIECIWQLPYSHVNNGERNSSITRGLFSIKAIDEFFSAIKSVKNDCCEVDEGRYEKLCKSIYKVVEYFISVGCCSQKKYKRCSYSTKFIYTQHIPNVCNKSTRIIDRAQYASFSICRGVCEKYCIDVLKEFANKYREDLDSAKVQRDWQCFGKTEYGYIVIYGKMYAKDVKPKYKNSVLYQIPGIYYGVIQKCVEIKNKDLTEAVISQIAEKASKGKVKEWEIRERIVQCIVKRITDCIGRENTTGSMSCIGSHHVADYISKGCNVSIFDDGVELLNGAAISEFYLAVGRVKNGEKAVVDGGSDLVNLYNSIYNVIDNLMAVQYYRVEGCKRGGSTRYIKSQQVL